LVTDSGGREWGAHVQADVLFGTEMSRSGTGRRAQKGSGRRFARTRRTG
jgi:hypothetical protein